MKKITGVLALVLAVMMIFAACGTGNDNKAAESTAAATTETASTAVTEKPTELTMMVMVSPQTDLALVQDEINKILAPKGLKVNVNQVAAGAYMQQQNLVLSSNEKVDLMLTFPNTYISLVAQNKIQEIGPLLDKYGTAVKESLGKFLQGSMVNGKIYGVRPFTDLACGGGLVIRKDIVDKYQLDFSNVKGLADFTSVFQAIKDKEPNAPILTYSNASMGWLEYEMQYHVTKLNDYFGVIMPEDEDTYKVSNIFESQYYADMLKLMREWYTKGYFMKDVATATDDMRQLIKANRAYSFVEPTKPGLEVQETSSCGMPMVIVEYLGQPQSQTSMITLFQWVVPNGSENPEKAVQLLNEMYSNADIVNLLAYGIEGKHYEKKADGTIGFLEGKNSDNSGYYVNSSWMMGNGMLSHVWTGGSPDLWKQMKEFNEKATVSKVMGFSYDATPVKTEVAALTSAYGQYKRALESGSVDPNKVLPEMLAKLKASGLEKVIAEKQKQLDAWKAANVK